MDIAGQLKVDVSISSHRVSRVELRSSRRWDACRILVNKPAHEALRTVPLLFAVCSHAQSAAAHLAMGEALGLTRSAAEVARMDFSIAAEALDNHAMQFAAQWPRLLGFESDVSAWRALRDAVQALPTRKDVSSVHHAFWRVFGDALPEALAGQSAWLTGSSCAQRALGRIHDLGLQELGRSRVPLLPTLDARWFDHQLSTRMAWEQAPEWNGGPAETGALAHWANHPLVEQLLGRYGNGLAARVTARVVDAASLVTRAITAAMGVDSSTEPAPPPRFGGSGRGAAVVRTARGLLAHQVAVADGAISSWRVVAPTEWNFHPNGALAQGVVGVAASDQIVLHRNVQLMVAGLDPCVEYEVRVLGEGIG